MAERTTQSWTTAPHFFVTREVDASGMVALREKLAPAIEKSHGVKFTHTDLMVALVARTLTKHPRINCSWTPEGIRIHGDVPAMMPELCRTGLNAIEAYHSDHARRDTECYLGLAKRYGLLVTGGSDFHGAAKPGVLLGTGYAGNLRIPANLLDQLRQHAR